MIADVSAKAQQALNDKLGIGIKAIKPEVSKDRIDGLVTEIVNNGYDKIEKSFSDQIVNYGQSVVDDTVRTNADFHYKAGLQPRIIRRAEAKCCEWCSRLGGSYEYPDVPKDVYRRHANCRCAVEYDAGGGKRQNVHTKQWTAEEERAKIEAKKAVRLPSKASKIDEVEKNLKKVPIDTGATYTKKELSKMPLDELRKRTEKLAAEWYASGRSGISFPEGTDFKRVAKDLASSGSRSSLTKDYRSIQRRLQQLNAENAGNTIVDSVGNIITKMPNESAYGIPNSITQTQAIRGGISRNYYGEDGYQSLQISNNDHGHTVESVFGQHGEHAHDYYTDENGEIAHGKSRELTIFERKENGYIL